MLPTQALTVQLCLRLSCRHRGARHGKVKERPRGIKTNFHTLIEDKQGVTSPEPKLIVYGTQHWKWPCFLLKEFSVCCLP